MRVRLREGRCEANGLCAGRLPEVFRLDDRDELHIEDDSPPEALRAELEAVVDICPRQALFIERERA